MFGKIKRTESMREAGTAEQTQQQDGYEKVQELGGKCVEAEHHELVGTAAATATVDLFSPKRPGDLAALDWLRAHSNQTRCQDLLQQIMAWSDIQGKVQVRFLAKRQGITLDRRGQSTISRVRECARKHFRSAIAQEKGRINSFPVRVVSGPAPEAVEEQPLCIGDVVDLRTLAQFQRQRPDMPAHLRNAVKRLTACTLNIRKTTGKSPTSLM